MERMRNATFCLTMPGDSASTRRLSETIMAGCIPVFVGPPYASMPMAEHVRYRDFSVFFNVSDYSGWLQDKMEWVIHPSIRPYHVLNPWTWIPELEVIAPSPLWHLWGPIWMEDARQQLAQCCAHIPMHVYVHCCWDVRLASMKYKGRPFFSSHL